MNTNTAIIRLYDRMGMTQSLGTVRIRHGRVTRLRWVFGGDHAVRTPVTLIRRIALDWVADGADRRYTGYDERTGIQFAVTPTDTH